MKAAAIWFLSLGVVMFFGTSGLWKLIGFHPHIAVAWVSVSLILCALGLYALREWSRLTYGLVELAFGVAITVVAVNAYGVAQDHDIGQILGGGIFHMRPEGTLQLTGPQIALFGMLAAIYVLVRAFDNIGEGVRRGRTLALAKTPVQSEARLSEEASHEHTRNCGGDIGVSSRAASDGDGGRSDDYDGTTGPDAHHRSNQ